MAISDKLIRRWTTAELDARQAALESLPAEQWSREDHYAALEFLFQRYYPRTEPLLQSKWDSVMANLRAKVDENLRLAALGIRPSSKAAERNSLIEQHYGLLRDSYDMSLSDFERIVLPALNRFPFAKGLELAPEDLCALYQASAAGHTPAGRSARDRLVGRYHNALLDTANALRTIYETLRRAQNAGCVSAKLIAPKRCSCLGDLLDDRLVSIADVLHAYEAGAPLYPPHRTPCTVHECLNPCYLTLLPRSPSIRRPGDDEDFAKFMEDIFLKDSSPPAPNWQQILEERTQAAEREQ